MPSVVLNFQSYNMKLISNNCIQDKAFARLLFGLVSEGSWWERQDRHYSSSLSSLPLFTMSLKPTSTILYQISFQDHRYGLESWQFTIPLWKFNQQSKYPYNLVSHTVTLSKVHNAGRCIFNLSNRYIGLTFSSLNHFTKKNPTLSSVLCFLFLKVSSLDQFLNLAEQRIEWLSGGWENSSLKFSIYPKKLETQTHLNKSI